MKVHLAVAVQDLEASVADYNKRLGQEADLVIPGEYALWRTKILNLSIRVTGEEVGRVRHVGFEDEHAAEFTAERDLNGLLWENFNSQHQAQEIQAAWPSVQYTPK